MNIVLKLVDYNHLFVKIFEKSNENQNYDFIIDLPEENSLDHTERIPHHQPCICLQF